MILAAKVVDGNPFRRIMLKRNIRKGDEYEAERQDEPAKGGPQEKKRQEKP
jgi:hypothetical protein